MFLKITAGIASVVALLTLVVLIARRAPSTVHAKRTFAAPPEKIWAAWTDPAVLARWWGPDDFTGTVVKNDVRVGGTFVLCMKHLRDDATFCNAGTYDRVDPKEGFSARFAFSDETGTPMPGLNVPVPGHWPDSVILNFTLKVLPDGKTRVDVWERGVPMIMKFPARWGWAQQFTKLGKLLP